MATYSTTDEPLTHPEDWREPPAEPEPWMPPEPAPVSRKLSKRIREELFQPRYLVIAGIILLLIILQVWVLF
ncbi:hypothetical protein BH24CHL4_BH24CHL4_22150 [soil metagenome]